MIYYDSKIETFKRWSRKPDINDDVSCAAIEERMQGLIDADLEGRVFKKCVPLPGRGKRGDARTIVGSPDLRRFAVKRSRLLNETCETARGLQQIGALGKQTMREFDALTLPAVRELTAKQIRAIRIRSRVSQAVFAAMLNTSISTVQKWEIGEKRPSGPSLKLLNVIQRKGISTLT